MSKQVTLVLDDGCGKTKLVSTFLDGRPTTEQIIDNADEMRRVMQDLKRECAVVIKSPDEDKDKEHIDTRKTPFEEDLDRLLNQLWRMILYDVINHSTRIQFDEVAARVNIHIANPDAHQPLVAVAQEATPSESRQKEMDKLNKLARKQENRQRRK